MGEVKKTVGSVVGKHQTATIQPNDTIATAAQEMRDRNVGSLVVVGAGGEVVGIITERDVVSGATASCADPRKMHVADIMNSEVACCDPATSISEANRMMVSHHIRHLPVIEDGKSLGMISSRDVLAHQLQVTTGMRASAEQTARLIKCLKSLELDEVLKVIGSEVPNIFQAERWVLHLSPGEISNPCRPRLLQHQCPCPEEHLFTLWSMEESSERSPVLDGNVPCTCERLGCTGPRVLIRLGCDGRVDEHGNALGQQQDFLCMCGLPAETEASEEVLEYKGDLMQDILDATLANAVLYEEARRHGLIDPLTGLKTRRVLEMKVAEEYAKGRRYDTTFCMAMMDVDSFKNVNDTHGHPAGDEILRSLAELLLTNARDSDIIVRYGGDEFVVLMPETDLESATIALERIRSRAAESLSTPDGSRVTISCGVVAGLSPTDHTPDNVLHRADSALYDAKEAGGNCVVAPVTASTPR